MISLGKLNTIIIKNLYNIIRIEDINDFLLFKQYIIFKIKYILPIVQKVTP